MKSLQDILKENEQIASIPVPDSPSPAKREREYRTFQRSDMPPVLSASGDYECSLCEDTGYIKYDVPPGHIYFGKLLPCADPNCPVQRRNKERRLALHLERMHRHCGKVMEYYPNASIEHLDMSKGKTYAARAARYFVTEGGFEMNGIFKNSLVLTGPTGTGKTYIASAVHNALRDRMELVWFTRLWSLVKAVQAGYNRDSEMDDNQVLDAFCHAPYLIIDEFQMNRQSEDRTDIIEAVMNTRSALCLPTLITTNLSQDDIGSQYNHRIKSRMVGMAWWVEVGGATRRDTTPVLSEGK